jgi:hypothetical protein
MFEENILKGIRGEEETRKSASSLFHTLPVA